MIKVEGVRKLVQATWLAIGWIAIETAVAWFQALRKPKAPKAPKGRKRAASSGARASGGEAPAGRRGDEELGRGGGYSSAVIRFCTSRCRSRYMP